jgi:ribosomal protein S14
MPRLMATQATQAKSDKRSRSRRKPRCEDCYFHQNMLCALGLSEPCPTFRPAHPDGLRPPQQLTFIFRSPRPQGAWPPPESGELEIAAPPLDGFTDARAGAPVSA